MRKLTITGMIFFILLAGCNTNKTDDENIQKLLDRQTEMQQKQEESELWSRTSRFFPIS